MPKLQCNIPKPYHEVKEDLARVICTPDDCPICATPGCCALTVTMFPPSMLHATRATSMTRASRVKDEVLSTA